MNHEACWRYAEQFSPSSPVLDALWAHTQTLSNKACGPVVGQFLALTVTLQQPSLCLELGTWQGYSSLWIAGALPPGARLITVDADARCVTDCPPWFAQHPRGHCIEQRHMKASDFLRNWHTPIEWIFVDADKMNYPEYYDQIVPLLAPGGVAIFDNMLWGGAVCAPDSPKAQLLHELNQRMHDDPRVTTTFLPLRDGLHVVHRSPAAHLDGEQGPRTA